MTKSPIFPCVILLALAAIGGAQRFEVSPQFTAYSSRYESMMLSRTEQVFSRLRSHVNSVAGQISQVKYLQSTMNVPVVKETFMCAARKIEPTTGHVMEFVEMLIKLISYAGALGVEIRTCFVNAGHPGAPKVPACIMDVTAKVAQASIEYQQRLVLDAVRIFAAASGFTNTVQNCILHDN